MTAAVRCKRSKPAGWAWPFRAKPGTVHPQGNGVLSAFLRPGFPRSALTTAPGGGHYTKSEFGWAVAPCKSSAFEPNCAGFCLLPPATGEAREPPKAAGATAEQAQRGAQDARSLERPGRNQAEKAQARKAGRQPDQESPRTRTAAPNQAARALAGAKDAKRPPRCRHAADRKRTGADVGGGRLLGAYAPAPDRSGGASLFCAAAAASPGLHSLPFLFTLFI